MSEKTSVYRYFAADGQLLYVGCTHNPFSRAGQNGWNKPMGLVQAITLEWHDTRADAIASEAKAIRDESPVWNVQGRAPAEVGKPTGELVTTLNVGGVTGRTANIGAHHSIRDVPRRLEQLQLLYDNREFEVIPKIKQRGPQKGERVGYTIKGKGKLGPLREALNACVKGEKDIENTLTISRWMEDGCEGLRLRPEDQLEE